MKINRYLIASVASTLAASAWAQSPPSPLNLSLPANSAAATSPPPVPAKVADKTALTAVATTAAAMPALENPPPASAQYDANANAAVDAADSRGSATASCDDAAYGQPQMHGSIGMGVVAGNHVSGNYQTGNVNMTKALGSCDHPTGTVGLSISVGQGRFNGRNYGPGHW